MTDAPPITLRPATTTDAERIAALFTDEGYPAGPSDIVERLERFASDHSQVLVAEGDGVVLGGAGVVELLRQRPQHVAAGRKLERDGGFAEAHLVLALEAQDVLDLLVVDVAHLAQQVADGAVDHALHGFFDGTGIDAGNAGVA